MKTSVALIGFMGTGKTAVGRELSVVLGKQFIETDELIERKAGKSITQIFEQDGEIAFRELEIEVTKAVAATKNAVIACGGGLVLNKINIDRLRQEAVIIYLTASPRVILQRTTNDVEERPLLKVTNPTGAINELLKFRKPFYERAADISINTSKLDVASVIEEIIIRLKDHENFSF